MGWLVSRLYDRMMRRSEEAGLREWRRQLLAGARGVTVELGAGTGLNLPFYPPEVERIVLTEPDRHMGTMLARRVAEIGDPRVEVAQRPADELGLPDASVDTVLCTLVLCSVPDPAACLAEVRRVLRPGGQLLFLEHVLAEDQRARRWQYRLDPFWQWCAEGCCLTRPTSETMAAAGFALDDVVREPMPATPFWVRASVRGAARVAAGEAAG